MTKIHIDITFTKGLQRVTNKYIPRPAKMQEKINDSDAEQTGGIDLMF